MNSFKRFFQGIIISCLAVAVFTGCDTKSNSYNITINQKATPEALPNQPAAESQPSSNGLNNGATTTNYQETNEPKIWPIGSDEVVEVAKNPLAENYYIVLDASGSMAKVVVGQPVQKRITAAKNAIRTFVSGLPKNVNLGLLTFQPTRELVKLGPDNHENVLQYLRRITPSGRTPLQNAIQKGSTALEAQAQRQSGYGTYKLIVVTDGRSTDGDPSYLAREIVDNSPVELHVIGFAVKSHSLNIPGVTQYVTANSTEELVQALTDVTKSEVEAFDASEFEN